MDGHLIRVEGELKTEIQKLRNRMDAYANANSHTGFLVQRIDPRAGSRFKAHREGDVGYDLEVWLPPNKTSIVIEAFQFVQLPTGLRVKVGDNAWGCIRPRSSTFVKRELFVMEGTIDPGYTGDLFVIVYNPGFKPKTILNGDRIAQLIPIPRFDVVDVTLVDEMPVTERGNNGFGSTDNGK